MFVILDMYNSYYKFLYFTYNIYHICIIMSIWYYIITVYIWNVYLFIHIYGNHSSVVHPLQVRFVQVKGAVMEANRSSWDPNFKMPPAPWRMGMGSFRSSRVMWNAGICAGKNVGFIWVYSEHVGIHGIYIANMLGKHVEKHGNYIDVDTHERVSSHNMNGT
jgi:hypothetical protein